MIGNTLTACWWMAAAFVTYYSINALFATHLQKDLELSPALIATPIVLRQPGCVPRECRLGLVVRPLRPALGDDHPGADRDADRADLPADHQLHS